jgi:hypothetical protein
MQKKVETCCKTSTTSEHPMGWPQMLAVRTNVMSGAPLAADADNDITAPETRTSLQLIDDYTKWNDWLLIAGGLCETMAAILLKNVNDPVAKNDILAACHALYNAISGMNNAVYDAIVALKDDPTKLPEVTFPPSKLPVWGDVSDPSLFSSAWDIAKPVLEMIDKKIVATHPDAPLVVALGGLIGAGDAIIKTLSIYFPEWGNKSKTVGQ